MRRPQPSHAGPNSISTLKDQTPFPVQPVAHDLTVESPTFLGHAQLFENIPPVAPTSLGTTDSAPLHDAFLPEEQINLNVAHEGLRRSTRETNKLPLDLQIMFAICGTLQSPILLQLIPLLLQPKNFVAVITVDSEQNHYPKESQIRGGERL